MKRFLGLVVVVLLMVGCASFGGNKEENFYSYDQFIITKANYDSVQIPTPNSEAEIFNVVKNYYNNLKRLSVESSGTGSVSQSELYNSLTKSFSWTRSEANSEINFLNTYGNNVFTFDAEKGPEYYFILYLEK